MPTDQPPSARATVHRLADRASYDRDEAYAILDAGFVAHVGLATDDGPVVLPMAYARDGDRLLMHGSAHSRLMQDAAAGVPVCVTVTLVDGIVLARSEFRHGINYRSVVAFGEARALADGDKEAALRHVVEGIVPGRTTGPQPPRTPSDIELQVTGVLAVPLDELSVKRRSGGPLDENHDLGLAVWAGQIPLTVMAGPPIADEQQLTDPPEGGVPPVPAYAAKYSRG